MPVSVAIVGAGPSGFYTAEALAKSDLDVEIDMIERLPAPFGLIRYGVAPDHQTTKNVIRAYSKTAQEDCCRFWGNVEIGRDLSMGQLREMYDAVVVSVGSALDRPLGIPGDDKKGVVGAAAFVGWYNGHPDFADLDPPLDCARAVVIGQGNVAIDISRVLVKTREELAVSDIVPVALEAIQASPIRDVHMVGRRGPVEAKFTNVELREMGELADAAAIVDPDVLPEAVPEDADLSDRDRRLRERNLATMRGFTEQDASGKSKRVHFDFLASPVEIIGSDRVEAVRFERNRVVDGRARGTGEFYTLECGLVLPAIGYRAEPIDGLPHDASAGVVPSDDGKVEPGLYVAGWVKRGPTGVIGSNKPDGRAVADHIAADIPQGTRPGRAALEAHLRAQGGRIVDFADWQKIDAAEIAAAGESAPRRKFTTIADMLAVLGD